ncbi:uncharacterized protein TM35_000421520 [Trypanosoma theileri]|uniref:Uncharacterized protein n=1 Tax=Trypanosoma theileri TaxID=67003 RepID=A0A1X0NIV1_9TRYP|nr:uncharacterized protein TM35_000421520 [Trypanosoma theileri]ORC84694.1 hypothetical protein TM35_000421520 [Trypanosoma theileri]
MESYTFATIRGVLMPSAGNSKRPYVPKGSRTHISVTAATDVKGTPYIQQEEKEEKEQQQRQLGTLRRLKPRGMGNNNDDDGKDSTEDDNNMKHQNKQNNNNNNNNNNKHDDPLSVMMTGLIATDPREGTRLTRSCALMDGDVYWESTPLPSQERIGCIQLTPETHTAMLQAGTNAAVFSSPILYVADVVGNVYCTTLPAASAMISTDEAPTKRIRQESNDDNSFWKLIAASASSSSSSSSSSLLSSFPSSSSSSLSTGARGWCGLVPLPSNLLACCREFFFDLRLLDASAGTVVQEYSTTHPPTGISACAGVSHSVVIAEGPLASVYDVRCSGAVLQLEKDERKTSHSSPVTGRFTSPTHSVADVCTTSNEYEVAVAVGRSICVHDVRKWNCLSITTNVLKYEIGSIAPLASGKAVVAAGIDSEVRVIPLQKSEPSAQMAEENHNNPVNGSHKKNSTSQNNNSSNDGNNHNTQSAGEKEEGTSGMSFRNRIDSVVSCGSTWQGGWVTSLDGSCASGISVDYELFLSC